MQFFRSRRWVVTRRLILVALVLAAGYRSYGGAIGSWFRGPDPARDILISRAEFRPSEPGVRPGWIIVFRNQSSRFSYDRIKVEATYLDDAGNVLETDSLVIDQKLAPGSDQVVGSLDPKNRGSATQGRLRVLDAASP
jgi:hypothetical protein